VVAEHNLPHPIEQPTCVRVACVAQRRGFVCLFATALPSTQCPCTRRAQVVGAHPNVLAYSVAERLRPAIEYLQEIGVTDIAAVITERPSLLGLDPEQQLRRVVEYFKANGKSQEEIIELVSKCV
jgi:hypothetical protein